MQDGAGRGIKRNVPGADNVPETSLKRKNKLFSLFHVTEKLFIFETLVPKKTEKVTNSETSDEGDR